VTKIARLASLTRTTVPVWEEYDYEDTPDNIELVIADIRKRTPFADNTFDVVHMRQMRLVVRSSPTSEPFPTLTQDPVYRLHGPRRRGGPHPSTGRAPAIRRVGSLDAHRHRRAGARRLCPLVHTLLQHARGRDRAQRPVRDGRGDCGAHRAHGTLLPQRGPSVHCSCLPLFRLFAEDTHA
jgi:hypothetical protein